MFELRGDLVNCHGYPLSVYDFKNQNLCASEPISLFYFTFSLFHFFTLKTPNLLI
nr:MAG TPA: hypothetical protein [Caudoviricetes sp.]DAT31972.1 MAG TPA: hypothetical protein [Caudoviricetes sp.]